jgi:CPA2 family monovalent cation:H+ antiporter-2
VRSAPRRQTAGAAVRRSVAFLLVDMTILVALIIGTSFAQGPAVAIFVERTGSSRALAVALVTATATLLAFPFLLGIARIARRLGALLAQIAFPGGADGSVDTAAAPRRALLVSLELAIVLLVGLPSLAIAQPFIGGYAAPVFALGIIVTLGVALWRTANNLDGHVRAGAQMVLEVLAAQSHAQRPAPSGALPQVDRLLPGLGAPASFELDAASPAAGKTLRQLDLRGRTGATVLAIQRGDAGHSLPSGHEVLQGGDVLALAGTEESIAAARALLAPGEAR